MNTVIDLKRDDIRTGRFLPLMQILPPVILNTVRMLKKNLTTEEILKKLMGIPINV